MILENKEEMIKELKDLLFKIENNEVNTCFVSHRNNTDKQEFEGIRNGRPEFIIQYEYIDKKYFDENCIKTSIK